MKKIFDRKAKPNDFYQGDLVLKWDARHEDKGKHGKFDHLWKGCYLISENHRNNSYSLQGFDGDPFLGSLHQGLSSRIFPDWLEAQ